MHNIITLEVLEDHIQRFERKLFGHNHYFSVEYKKGSTITVKHSIDQKHQALIDEGKLKVVKELFPNEQGLYQ